jgi:hypothetical protein
LLRHLRYQKASCKLKQSNKQESERNEIVEIMTIKATHTIEGLTEVVAEMQRFFATYRERRVERSAAKSLYEALLWSLRNFEIEEGHQSYIRGNCGPSASSSGAPLEEIVAEKITHPPINEPRDHETARGGEVELALRSVLDILRNGKPKVSEEAAVATINKHLAKLIGEFDVQGSAAGWDGR